MYLERPMAASPPDTPKTAGAGRRELLWGSGVERVVRCHGVEKGLRSQISTLNAQLKTFQDKHQVAEQKCERVLLAARLQKKEGVQWGESRPADSRLSNEPPKVARKTLYGTDEDGDDDDDYGDGDYSDYRPKRSVKCGLTGR